MGVVSLSLRLVMFKVYSWALAVKIQVGVLVHPVLVTCLDDLLREGEWFSGALCHD